MTDNECETQIRRLRTRTTTGIALTEYEVNEWLRIMAETKPKIGTSTDDEREAQRGTQQPFGPNWHDDRCGHNFVIRSCPYEKCEAKVNALALDKARVERDEGYRRCRDANAKVSELAVALNEARAKAADYEEVLADHRRLVRELDVALNGAAAAEQASLCDLVPQITRLGLEIEQAVRHRNSAQAALVLWQRKTEDRDAEIARLHAPPEGDVMQLAHDIIKRWPLTTEGLARALTEYGNQRAREASSSAIETLGYQRTFNAIADATRIEAGHIAISVEAFLRALGDPPDNS